MLYGLIAFHSFSTCHLCVCVCVCVCVRVSADALMMEAAEEPNMIK